MNGATQAEIAKQLGVSKMTVSRALRGEKNVRAELRVQIEEMAEKLGYRPDPEVSRMMAHLRASRGSRRGKAIGFVWTERPDGPFSAWAGGLIKGARAKAESLGYGLDEFQIVPRKMPARRIAEVMEHRGIQGFVLSPLVSRSRGHLNMPWEKFSCVMIGIGYTHPALDRVHHHHFLGMMTSLRQLKKDGYRRIGFFADAQMDQRMYGAWSASFMAHHQLPAAEAAPLMCLMKAPSRSGFREWVKLAKPDVVLTAGTRIHSWLADLGEDVRPALAMLAWSEDHSELPGLNQQSDVLGATAIELVVDRIHRNERGIPKQPKMVMTSGVWRAVQKSR